MPITSGQISQQFAAQQAYFGGQMAYSQQLAYPMQAALRPGMPPPPPPSAAGAFFSAQPAQFGQAGERMAASGMSTAAMAGGIGMTGMQAYGFMGGKGAMGAAGRAMDPFSYAGAGWRAGQSMGTRMGMGMLGRGALGATMGAGAMLPIYGAYKMAETYGSAFSGGMQNQSAMNQTVRQNFQHFGGGGAMGRGFSQGQMGQIGMDVASQVRNDPTMGMGQATQLIGRGAQMGEFQGVNDVSKFTQKFRQMLDTLKGVQRELGGSLNDALTFVNEARQSGVFQQADRLRLAAGQRTVSATTGLSAVQAQQMTQFGSQLARQMGGRASQGAFGAQRAMSQVGAAVQAGALNEEQIFNITGQSGAEGQMAFAQRQMQTVARFSRTAAGRYTIFGMANERGTGLDPTQLARLQSGDMGPGELSRSARRNVNRMGRARSLNQEGELRGALLEQGGVSGRIGMMRMQLGNRFNENDPLASLVLQRRFRMDRHEADANLSLMRNQGAIAQQEQLGAIGASRESAQRRQLQERGLDPTLDRLAQTMKNRLGITATEEMGQRTMTRISSIVERAMNDMLGITEHQMTSGTAAAMGAASIGRASRGQMQRIEALSRASGESASALGGADSRLFQGGGLPSFMGGRRSRGETLEMFGFNVTGMGAGEGGRAIQNINQREGGIRGAMFGPERSLAEALGGISGRGGLKGLGGRAMTPQEVETASMQTSMALRGQVTGGAAEAMGRFAEDPYINRRIGRAQMLAQATREQPGRERATMFEFMRGREFRGAERDEEGQLIEKGAESSDARLGLTALMARQGMTPEGLGDPSQMRGGPGGIIARTLGDLGVGGVIRHGLVGTGAILATALEAPQTAAGSRYEEAMRAVSSGGELLSRKGLQTFAANDEQRRAIADRHRSIGREAFEAAYADETVNSMVASISRASEAGDVTAVQAGINALERHGNTLSGTQGSAVASIAQQMGQETDRLKGRISPRHRANLTPDEDILAAREEAGASGRAMTRIAEGIRGDSSQARFLRENFRMIGRQQQTQGQEAAGYQTTENVIASMVVASDEEASTMMAALGSARDLGGEDAESERARAQRSAIVGEVSRRRGVVRRLQGRGRGGQRGARRTALNMITGGGFEDMEFTVGGRTVSGSRAQGMVTSALSGRGRMSAEDRASVRRQLVEQMEAGGQEEAEAGVSTLQTALINQTEGEGAGRISQGEAIRLEEQTREDASTQQVRERRRAEAAEARDPLGTSRNQTLTEIAASAAEQTALLRVVAENIGNGDDGPEEGGADKGKDD